MTNYSPPIEDQRFALDVTARLFELSGFAPFAAVTPDLVDAILGEAGRMTGAFAELNQKGDTEGARWTESGVTLPLGFAEAYAQFVEGQWGALSVPEADGGQGLPLALSTAVSEQLAGANMAFSLCMFLTSGAVEALRMHGSKPLKAAYLEKLVTGAWTGTMNLTEPQAGSDVGALRTRAERTEDGSYRIKGSKIFITWADHDLTDNVIHLVLARVPGAASGTKGISLFLVPKYLLDAEGSSGLLNDVRCVSIEHKLGVHASPTCTMSFGDNDACVGYLVGEEHGGMRAMFTMMNHARLNVGLQGVGVAEAAYQQALDYARQRVQSAKFGGGREAVAIIEHADVRRMLMTMKSTTEAIRAIAFLNAAAIDRAYAETSDERRRDAQAFADLLTPITKSFATDAGVEIAPLGIQVFGGMGFIEETGAAQYYRDARIAPIYEGTNGIQALDLVGRKLRLDGGRPRRALICRLRAISQLAHGAAALAPAADALDAALSAVIASSDWLEQKLDSDPEAAAAGATPYLKLFGTTLGAALLLEQALEALRRLDTAPEYGFLKRKIQSALYYATQILPTSTALAGPIMGGASTLAAEGFGE